MTREESISVLEHEWFAHEKGSLVEKAIEVAISALREQDEQKVILIQQYIKVPEPPQWISVEERPPQETGEVCKVVNLMMDNGLVTAGWINDITGLGYFLDSKSSFIRQAPISRFTHWMPLHKPPKEEV